MCGVAGILDLDAAVEPHRLARMAHSLAHRGPDGEGYFVAPGIGLAYRRLAIVDVAGGQQPLSDERGDIQVVFNGEIYNHRALRARLVERGHTLTSGSDGAVIAHLYEEHGLGFVDHLDGDFAIALWDGRLRRLTLARDPVGVKPLYYHVAGGRLQFASEVKALFASGLCAARVDPQGLRDVFGYGQPTAPGTFWAGVHDLPPGHLLVADEQAVTLRRYFTPLDGDPNDLLSGRPAVEQFRSALVEAVRKRLPDEVAFGATLSGGLDSTAVVATISAILGTPVQTASIRLPGSDLDEGRYSRLAAKALGVDNVEIEFGGAEACAHLAKTLWHLEAPQWFGVATPFLKVTGIAAERGAKVALTGDGADELLGGYSWYVLQRLEQRLGRLTRAGLDPLRRLILGRVLAHNAAPAGAAAHLLAVPGRLADAGDRFGGGAPAWYYLWSAMDAVAPALLRPSSGALAPSRLPAPPTHTALHRSLHYEYQTRLPSWVLMLSDRLSMANGVEVRVPFMDRALLDLSARLDPRVLMRGTSEKHILKEALRDVVPAPIRRRRKKPFFTPITPWYLTGPGEELAATYLGPAAVRASGLFDPAEVTALHQAALRGAGRTWEGTVAEWASMAVLTTHLLLEVFHDAAATPAPTALPAALASALQRAERR
ncbi:asparagine synthase (glutamine-hydrolyzing) [Micromonospora sp. NPDC005215]|uniref:asparagine synthase (glutamine-hydrolyzing) n=1 Tax=Micromonospora sp. NPDC005215 TaxID=3157024 RepID=UPI0033A319FE